MVAIVVVVVGLRSGCCCRWVLLAMGFLLLFFVLSFQFFMMFFVSVLALFCRWCFRFRYWVLSVSLVLGVVVVRGCCYLVWVVDAWCWVCCCCVWWLSVVSCWPWC